MDLDFEKLKNSWLSEGILGLKNELKQENNAMSSILFSYIESLHEYIENHPEELPSQLYARINESAHEVLRQFVLQLANESNSAWLKTFTPFPPEEEALIGQIDAHSNFIQGLVCLSNTQFITSSEDGHMILWDIESMQPVQNFVEHEGYAINHLALSRDRKYLVSSGDDNHALIWDTYSWRVIHVLKGHNDYVSRGAITSSGLVITGSRDQTVRVWDLNSGECLQQLEGHNAWVYLLAASPDGSRAITGSINNTMIVWDLREGKILQKLVDGGGDVHYVMGLILDHKNESGVGHREYPVMAEWLHTNRIITGANDIIVWNDLDFSEEARFIGHNWKMHLLRVFGNEQFIVSGAQSIKIWDLKEKKEITSLLGHEGADIYSGDITPNEKHLITGDKKGKVRIWDLDKLIHSERIIGHLSYAASIKVSDEMKFAVTGGYDKTAIVWNARKLKPIHYLRGHNDFGVVILGFRNERREVITSSSGEIKIWNIESGELIKTIIYENELYHPENGIILEQGTKIFCSTMSYSPTLWDIENGSVQTFKVGFGFSGSMIISKDNTFILTKTYPTNILDMDNERGEEDNEPNKSPVILWDVKKSQIAKKYWIPENLIQDDQEISTNNSNDNKKYYPTCALFNYDETKVIAGFSEGSLCIWDRYSGSLIKTLKIADKYLSRMFLLNEKKLLTVGNQETTIKVWNLENLELEKVIEMDTEDLTYHNISPNKKYLALAIKEKMIGIIDLVKGELECTFNLGEEIRHINYTEYGIYIGTERGYLYGFELICPQ
ncbi:MAG: hypothetical protein BAJALOKI1v1_1350007 [Promethearchaeota archaeon]|nr:MAG: hypothetical protein BAJALOKI1v1_1350007 [Candidatus Lokiarchaeota archaeon]